MYITLTCGLRRELSTESLQQIGRTGGFEDDRTVRLGDIYRDDSVTTLPTQQYRIMSPDTRYRDYFDR